MFWWQRLAGDSNATVAAAASKAIGKLKSQWQQQHRNILSAPSDVDTDGRPDILWSKNYFWIKLPDHSEHPMLPMISYGVTQFGRWCQLLVKHTQESMGGEYITIWWKHLQRSHQSDGRCGKYRIIYIIYRKEWNTLLFAIHQQHCPMIHTDYALRCNTLQTQSLSTITWSCIWWQHRRWRKLRQPESLIPHLSTSCIFF